jgi:hypothetical protein
MAYRRADNSRPVSFTVSAREWVYATNLSRVQRKTRERETSRRHVGEAHSVLTTAILLPQCPNCCWGKIVSLRMLTNLRLADWRLTTAQQRSTGQNLPPTYKWIPPPRSVGVNRTVGFEARSAWHCLTLRLCAADIVRAPPSVRDMWKWRNVKHSSQTNPTELQMWRFALWWCCVANTQR